MPRVTIVDYGAGNLLSVRRACEYWGCEVSFTDTAKGIDQAEHLILPGVGAFLDGMTGLRVRGLIEPIRKFAAQDRPFLGICLGMQMMLEVGEEFGQHEGLGIIPGRVVKISDIGKDGLPHKVPFVGWNSLVQPRRHTNWDNTVLSGIGPGSEVYFVHSFTAVPTDESNRLADCQYDGVVISAVIRAGNLYGCQFHPEKSGPIGLKIIRSFINLEQKH